MEKLTIRRIKTKSIMEILAILTGLFSSMPIVGINIAGNTTTLFTLTLMLMLIVMVMQLISKDKYRLKTNKYINIYILWLVMAGFSTIWGILYFSFTGYSEWKDGTIGYLPKIIIYICFAVLWSSVSDEKISECLLKGLMYGFIANIIWGAVDGTLYYITGRSINNEVFSGYINNNNIRYGTLSLIYNNGSIRVSGFNADPANIGFIAPVVIAYSLYRQNYILLCFSLMALLFSQSTTGILTTILTLLICNKVILGKRRINKYIKYVFIIVMAILVLVVVSLIGSNILQSIGSNIDNFRNRIFDVYLSIESIKYESRFVHLVNTIPAIFNIGFNILIGTGFYTMSFAYYNNPFLIIPMSVNNPYDVDTTYLSYLFDVGIFGLILYVYILYKIIKTYQKLVRDDPEWWSIFVYITIICLVISHFTYHYILFAPQVLLIVVSLGLISKIRLNRCESNCDIRELFTN